jgi:hypothetical protein
LPVKFQAGFHHGRVVENSFVLGEFIQGFGQAQGRAVRTMGAHGLHHIGHAQDPGFQANFLPLQTLGIAGAIQPLVMLKDNFGSVARERDGLQDIIGYLGMGFDQGKFLGSEFTRLRKKIRGDGELSQIMECAGYPKIMQAILQQAHLSANGTGDLAYPPLMANSIGVPGCHR